MEIVEIFPETETVVAQFEEVNQDPQDLLTKITLYFTHYRSRSLEGEHSEERFDVNVDAIGALRDHRIDANVRQTQTVDEIVGTHQARHFR